MAPSYHGSRINWGFQGKEHTHPRSSNNKSGIPTFSFPPPRCTRSALKQQRTHVRKHKYAPLSSSSVHSLPSLFFHSRFIISAFGTLPASSSPPSPSDHLYLSGHPTSHTCTPFRRLSGRPSHVISYPARPGLPHLRRVSNRIQPEYLIYYLQTQVTYLL